MSTPISTCQIISAATGDEQMFQRLVEVMDYNLAYGIFTIFPCQHSPKCQEPTEEELEKFHMRLMAAIEERRKIARAKAPKRTGSFEKFIFPVIKNMAAPLRAKDFHAATQNDNDARNSSKHD